MEKQKKQFRLFDIYREFALKDASRIKGISTYKVVKNVGECEIIIVYTNGIETNFVAKNEYELKEVVKRVNKQLKNCSKPGKPGRKN